MLYGSQAVIGSLSVSMQSLTQVFVEFVSHFLWIEFLSTTLVSTGNEKKEELCALRFTNQIDMVKSLTANIVMHKNQEVNLAGYTWYLFGFFLLINWPHTNYHLSSLYVQWIWVRKVRKWIEEKWRITNLWLYPPDVLEYFVLAKTLIYSDATEIVGPPSI